MRRRLVTAGAAQAPRPNGHVRSDGSGDDRSSGTFGRMRAVAGLRAALEPSENRRSTGTNTWFLVSLVLVLAALILRGTAWWQGNHGDLLDFVEGGRSILLGRDVYADIPGVMPFNYPPFGAVVMVPFALLGMPVAFPVLTALSVLSYAVIVVAVAKVAHVDARIATLVGLGGLALEPVFRTAGDYVATL